VRWMKFGDVRCKLRDKTRALSGGTFQYRLRTGEPICVHCSYVALYNIRLNIASSSHTYVLGSRVSHICTSVIKIQSYLRDGRLIVVTHTLPSTLVQTNSRSESLIESGTFQGTEK
jgi:hypothetical protein